MAVRLDSGKRSTGLDLERFYQRNRRIMTWVVFCALIWLLRGFFGLIFLTFVLTFIATPLSRLGQRWLRLPRRVSIVLVFALFLAALVSFTSMVVPRVFHEANTLLGNLDQIESKVIEIKNSLVRRYPALDRAVTLSLKGLVEEDTEAADATDGGLDVTTRADAPALAAATTATLARAPLEDERLAKLFVAQQGELVRRYAPGLLNAIGKVWLTILLALLFSFLISLDIARLTQEVQSLRYSRLRDFYEQTAQPVVRFGWVVGRAFQAQAVIACVNTLLTLIGLLALGVPSLAVLTLIVFLCSFIPVLGVFISTTPLVLVSLNSGGVSLALLVVALVTAIHLIEAYLLNPLIYGHHLKLNPVLVLIILFVGHHAFGLWGMLLGVPVTYYFIHDVFGVPLWKEARPANDGAGATPTQGGSAQSEEPDDNQTQ